MENKETKIIEKKLFRKVQKVYMCEHEQIFGNNCVLQWNIYLYKNLRIYMQYEMEIACIVVTYRHSIARNSDKRVCARQ